MAVAGAFLYGTWQPTGQSAPVALMEHMPLPQEVVLQANGGRQLLLTPATNPDSLAAWGTTLDAQEKLDYHKETAQAPVQHTLTTPRGKDFKVVLADGTEVWLNAESTLRYPSRFEGDERRVELEGEAYFKVAHDAEHPFIVQSGTVETVVLGTSFNVRRYPDSPSHITLVEGKVRLTTEHTTATLHPGDDALVEQEGDIRIRQVDTRAYTAWTNGYFYFENTQLSDIMSELGRWYNLTIRFNNPQAMHYHFNFWAKRNEPVESALALLNKLGQVKATIEGETLTID